MTSHSKTSKIIHWTFTLLYSYGIFKQVDDLSELEDPSLLNVEIIFGKTVTKSQTPPMSVFN